MADQQEGCDFKLEKLPDPGSGGCKGDGGGHCEEGGGGGVPPKNGFKLPKELQMAGKVVRVGMRVRDLYHVGCSAHEDYKQGTTRNVITTTTGIGGGLLGGEGGSLLGAAAGAPFGPVGVMVGGFLGAVVGGYVSKRGATYVVDVVGDKLQYNMEIRSCATCNRQFMARVYFNERRCQGCRQ